MSGRDGEGGHALVHLRLVGMAVMWGASWPAGRILAQSLSPVTGAAARFILASALLVVWHIAVRGWPRLTARTWALVAVAALVGVYAYALCFMIGLGLVPAGRASLVVTLNPAATILMAWVVYGERLTLWKGAGIVLATAGAIIALSHGEPMTLLTGGFGWGEVVLLGCVVTWSIYSLLGKEILGAMDAMTLATLTTAMGAPLLAVTAMATDGPAALNPAGWAWSALGAVVFLAVGATVIGYGWYFNGIHSLGAGVASGYITLVPVFGVLSSALVLHEPIDGSLAVGGVMAVAGLALMTIVSQR
ncbi:MAG: DMT family transporter [Hyphomicrobiaceae bacterium]